MVGYRSRMLVVEAICWSSKPYAGHRSCMLVVEPVSPSSSPSCLCRIHILVIECVSQLWDLYRRCRTHIVVAESQALPLNHLPLALSMDRSGEGRGRGVLRGRMDNLAGVSCYTSLVSERVSGRERKRERERQKRTSALLILVIVNFHLPPSSSRIFESMLQSSKSCRNRRLDLRLSSSRA
jgi:hypothetical protein